MGGAFFIYGEKIEIKYGDAKAKLDEALKQLIESVYSKLNLVNTFYESDADILTILNGDPYQGGLAGMGSNNEFALNEVSQWLEERHMSHVPVSMGDVQRRYQAIPYGWREIDIAALAARLIVSQKIEIRYGGAVVGKDDKNLVRYLRVKSEVDKASVSRRIAPSEDDMRKVVKFLREWLGQMSIAEDEDGLVSFVKDTLSTRLGRYETLLIEYSHDRYPQKEVVQNARDLMVGILSQKNDNVALLKRLLAKQNDLLDSTEDMEEVETFFKSQRTIFDSARVLQRNLQDERDYGYAGIGMRTGDNDRFLRLWFEVESVRFSVSCHSSDETYSDSNKWIPYNKGGAFRKWFGNNEYVVNWLNDGEEIKENTKRVYPQLGDNLGWKISNEDYYFKPGLTWTYLTSGGFGCRYYESGHIFDALSYGLFVHEENDLYYLAGLLNTAVASFFLNILDPSLKTGSGSINQIPYIEDGTIRDCVELLVKKNISLSSADWDAFETSWDFKRHPLLKNVFINKVKHGGQEWEYENCKNDPNSAVKLVSSRKLVNTNTYITSIITGDESICVRQVKMLAKGPQKG